MFQPQNAAGEPASLGDAFTSRSNSLIGLGLGLLAPSNPLRGQILLGQGPGRLPGWRAARCPHGGRRRHNSSTRNRRTPGRRRRTRSIGRWRKSNSTKAHSRLIRKCRAILPPPRARPTNRRSRISIATNWTPDRRRPREIFDPALGRNVIQEWDSRSKQYKTATDGRRGDRDVRSIYAGAVNPRAPGAAVQASPTGGATGAPGQPVLPARKPLTAHEQTAIDEADKALMANQQAIGNLQYAKQLSKQAASGPFALERGQVGSYLGGGMFGRRRKRNGMLHNTIINNAVDQLKATFGGNPSRRRTENPT